jgi:hypothetical protein
VGCHRWAGSRLGVIMEFGVCGITAAHSKDGNQRPYLQIRLALRLSSDLMDFIRSAEYYDSQ